MSLFDKLLKLKTLDSKMEINKDGTYWADWYTYFDTSEKTVEVGEELSLTLNGHLGMAYTPEELTDTALANIPIGLWKDGVFESIEDLKTDESGQVTLSFDEPGTYYITADGTVADTVTDYNLMSLGGDPAIYGTMDFTTYESNVAYTETDYSDGPYPASEIKYIDFPSGMKRQMVISSFTQIRFLQTAR